MSINECFTKKVKQWVMTDNEIKECNDQLKQLRLNRKQLGDDIIAYANNNRLSKSIINISDGTLSFVETKSPCYLTLHRVETCLEQYIDDTRMIDDIMRMIKDTRSSKITPEIKRTYNKDMK